MNKSIICKLVFGGIMAVAGVATAVTVYKNKKTKDGKNKLKIKNLEDKNNKLTDENNILKDELEDLEDDDKEETVKNRLNVYHEQTQPLIDYYTKQGCLVDVDGTQDMADVFAAIVKILGA